MDSKALFFSNKLKSYLSNNILELILFGSRARGNFHEGSDYDFLIVLKKKNKELIDKIRDVEVDFLNQYDILSASIIMSSDEWEKSKKLPIGINIMKEGIKL